MSFQRDIKFYYQGKEREATVQLDEESFDLTFDIVMDDGYEAVIFMPFDGNQWYEHKKGITELSTAIGKELDGLLVSKENSFVIRINHQNVSYTINVVPRDNSPLGMEYEIWIMDKFQFSVMQMQDEKGDVVWKQAYNNSGAIIDQPFVDKIGNEIETHFD